MRAAAWIQLSAIAALLLAGLAQVAPYAGLLYELHSHSLPERGRMASDPAHSFLGRAGRVALRERLAAPQRGALPAGAGDVWRWCYEVSQTLPRDARVFLGVPLASLYFQASFFWYPTRVDVTPEPAILRDQRSLARHARTPARAWLVQQGYTHLVSAGPGGLRLVELSADAP